MPFVVGISGDRLVHPADLPGTALPPQGGRDEDTRTDLEKAQAEVSRYAGRQVESEATTAPNPIAAEPSSRQESVHREIILWAYFLTSSAASCCSGSGSHSDLPGDLPAVRSEVELGHRFSS